MIVWSYLVVLIAQLVHMYVYFKILGVSGSVSTGINQSLRAVWVFVISAIYFCHLQESQCFNTYKLLSLIVVCLGVVKYALATAAAKPSNNKKQTVS